MWTPKTHIKTHIMTQRTPIETHGSQRDSNDSTIKNFDESYLDS